MFADVHIALSDIEVSVQDIINISSTLKADKAVGHEQPNVSSCKKDKKKLQNHWSLQKKMSRAV